MPGPLRGLSVVELAGLGAAPFAGMVLADLGADVIRVDRANLVVGGHTSATRFDVLNRSKRSIGVDLKTDEGCELVLRLVERADALIEGFRPGVTERLGVGPAKCLARNPRLVYGRMTGWGQEGPYASMAGHDIDYIALSGVLHSIGPAERPVPPLNLAGDFGGGGLLLALGLVSGILHARETGLGQVVDSAMVDGSALLSAGLHGFLAEGTWRPDRESNFLDGAAPFYTTYETPDGEHVAVGALEPQFYAEFVGGLGLSLSELPPQMDRDGWPRLREVFAARFAQKTMGEWEEHFAGTDACVAPVLSMTEAPGHAHNRERSTFVTIADVPQPAPAPRFSRSRLEDPRAPVAPGADTDAVLASLGYSQDQIGMLRDSGAVA